MPDIRKKIEDATLAELREFASRHRRFGGVK